MFHSVVSEMLIGNRSISLSSEAETAKVSMKLDILARHIKRLPGHIRKLLPKENERNAKVRANLENSIRSAECLVAGASTILSSRSCQEGSVLGEELDEQGRRRIQDWMEPIYEEESPPQVIGGALSDSSTLGLSPLSPLSPTSENIFIRTVVLEETDLALIQRWRNDAFVKYNAERFEDTERLLTKVLTLSGGGGNYPWRDEVMEMLASALYRQEKLKEAEEMLRVQFIGRDKIITQIAKFYCHRCAWDDAENVVRSFSFDGRRNVVTFIATSYLRHGMLFEAEKILLENLEDGKNLDVEGSKMLHALAVVHFLLENFEKAMLYCCRALRSRRAILGKYHILYFQSVRLRAEIFECDGDSDDAQLCKKHLPPNFEGMFLQVIY
jgi:hypothetical protein